MSPLAARIREVYARTSPGAWRVELGPADEGRALTPQQEGQLHDALLAVELCNRALKLADALDALSDLIAFCKQTAPAACLPGCTCPVARAVTAQEELLP